MWHVERDYIGASSPGPLTLERTYNSSPLAIDAKLAYAFGTRWSQPYDAVLKAESAIDPNHPAGQCFRRTDIDFVWCFHNADSTIIPALPAIPPAVSIVRGDGRKYFFSRSGTDWVAAADINDRVRASYNADNSAVTGWIYTSAQGDSVESYDAGGRLIAITSRSGAKQRLTYGNGTSNDTSVARSPADAPACTHVQGGKVLPAGRLLCVSDDAGRQLQFEYNAAGHVTKLIDPAGQETLYAYDGPSGGCTDPANTTNLACSANNLTMVTYPDGKSRTYFYNEASQISGNGGGACVTTYAVGNGFGHLINALTGLQDESGQRHIQWTYDCIGRATSSTLPNAVEKVTIAYDVPTAGARTVTHSLGSPASPVTTQSALSYATVLGSTVNTAVGQPCVECGPWRARTYDANGNTATSTDWNNTSTTYTYDLTRNLETSSVEAAGTAQARTVSTVWHANFRLPLQVNEALRRTLYAYDVNGNLLTKTVQATTDANGSLGSAAPTTGPALTWSYTYNTIGQVLTVTGPRTDVTDITRYTYDAQGNLASVTNAAGQQTTLSNYDSNGRVGMITDPNGLTTSLTYAVRGWLNSRSVGGETTNYDHDSIGQLTTVTQADGSTINYSYDDAHRLTGIADSLGNSILYTLDLTGNRIGEQIRDPSGALSRQTSRVFDTLNRLQQVTGAQR